MAETINTFFPSKDEEHEKVGIGIKEFVRNNPVEYTQKDEERLISKLESAREKGLRGLLHIVNYDSFTARPLKESLPENVIEKGFYERLFICDTESRGSQADLSREVGDRDTIVYVSENGELTSEDQEKLDESFKDRVGIIAGGGSKGDVGTQRAVPVLKALERTLEADTPTAGICLGHQYLWAILQDWKNGVPYEESVQPGYLEAGLTSEKLTDAGKEHQVFSRFGDRLTVVSFNMLHTVFQGDVQNDKMAYGNVLTRNVASNYPTGLSLDFASQGQALTFQRHPEVGIGGIEKNFLIEEKRYDLPSGDQVIVPKGSHPDLLILAGFLAGNFAKLSQKYEITEEDAKKLFTQEIITESLGKNFYGPLVEYLVDSRLGQ